MKKIILIIGVIIVVSLVWFLWKSQASKEETNISVTAQLNQEAPEAEFAIDNKTMKLSQFEGKPVMFWLIATWCPTCSAGTKVLAERISEIEKYDLQIITLKIYNNLGYPGPSIEEFGKNWAGEAFNSSNWFWGDASKEASFTYDPKGFPDIYYLIDKEGIIRAKDTAPSATINKIIDFAKSQ